MRLPPPRRGSATVELAVVLPLLAVLIFGLWDAGRMIETQQLLTNAAREGARNASFGGMLDSGTGTQRDVTAADVQNTVTNYLTQNKVPTAGLVVKYEDLDTPGATEPYQANQLDRLRVTVQLPFKNVRLILVNLFVDTNYTFLTGEADWASARDKNVNVGTGLPVN
jgi:Flp pilus assembly protein TadG